MINLLRDALRPVRDYLVSKNQREFLRLLDRYGRRHRCDPASIRFLQYAFDVPDCESFVYQFRDIFVSQIYRFRSESEKPVILDCGANIGMSCVYFRQLYPAASVTAYEADPRIAAYLTRNLAASGLADVEVIAKAVWTHDSGVGFRSEGADAGMVGDNSGEMCVPSIRLRNELMRVERIDFLKLDIEGAEADVLADCAGLLARAGHIFIEYHSRPGQRQRLGEILAQLTAEGFRYYLSCVAERKNPFLPGEDRGETFDLQMNISAWRRGK